MHNLRREREADPNDSALTPCVFPRRPLAAGRGGDRVDDMPPNGPTKTPRSLQQVADAVGLYPVDAYAFVQQGLTRTVEQVHGAEDQPRPGDAPVSAKATDAPAADDVSRHITGRDLCLGLRDEAWDRWGLLARTVLARWNVTSTLDFGRIVFALVEHQVLQKTDDDTIDDFRNVFDFRTALEGGYRVTPKVDAADARPKRAGKK